MSLRLWECQGCERMVPDTEADLCEDCLREEVCHQSYEEAARDLCGCKGGAAIALRILTERQDRERRDREQRRIDARRG